MNKPGHAQSWPLVPQGDLVHYPLCDHLEWKCKDLLFQGERVLTNLKGRLSRPMKEGDSVESY